MVSQRRVFHSLPNALNAAARMSATHNVEFCVSRHPRATGDGWLYSVQVFDEWAHIHLPVQFVVRSASA